MSSMKKIRIIRSRGKRKLVAINDKLNDLAWELSAENEAVADSNITKAVATIDEALETLHVAMVVLNTVLVDVNEPPAENLTESIRFKQIADVG